MVEYQLQPFYSFGLFIWRLMLLLIGHLCSLTPMRFSEETWNFISYEMYPWFLSIGAILLNIFFFVGVIRQTGNIRENMTLESFLDLCIKVVVANALMQSGLTLMREMFQIASQMSVEIYLGSDINFEQMDMDVSAQLFYAVFGIIFLVVSLVCSVTILMVVYGRYINLYLLVVSAPIALSTMAGGPGISQTAAAWFKTFLSKTFSIVLIIVAMAVGAKLCTAVEFLHVDSGLGAEFDGCIQALQNIFSMVLMTAAVKGIDTFMHRTFAL